MGGVAIDYSFSRFGNAVLKGAGVSGVIRYVCPLPNNKAITKVEYDQYKAGGIPVALVWEAGTTTWNGGYSVGLVHGKAARIQANAIGFPKHRPIYAAYDTGINPVDLSVALAYIQGFGVGSTGPVGAYGTTFLLNHLSDSNAIQYAWQTNARGWYMNQQDFAHAVLFQRFGKTLPGIPASAIDVSDINAVDWGQDDYVKTPTIPPIPSKPPSNNLPKVEYPTMIPFIDGKNHAPTNAPYITVGPNGDGLISVFGAAFTPGNGVTPAFGGQIYGLKTIKSIAKYHDTAVFILYQNGTSAICNLAAGITLP